MSGVILRCPNCGTMQSAEGQCDACHEAAVRYFCLNHEPGLWLDSAACPQCGARFGDPVPSRREEAPPVERSEVRLPKTPRAPPTASDPRVDMGPWGAGPPTELGAGRAPGPDPFRILIGAMAAAARARSARAERPSYDAAAPMRRRGGGCIGRIFMLILFLVALFLMAPIFLGALFGFG